MRIRKMTKDRCLWYAGNAVASAIGILLIVLFPGARSGGGLLLALFLCSLLPIVVFADLTSPMPKWEEEALKKMEEEDKKKMA
ncbi:hypothetical protein C4552_03585 [Candidatus Parcubacteria bacterium]|nr:MAG: hypothetical protein C4552_03585 [Candidatus Parcubacteria bacterium]